MTAISFPILFPTDSPVCVSSSVQIVGASLDETVSVPCRVNADPPDVEFEWSFSTSGERFEVPHGHYTSVQDINMDRGDGLKSASTLYDSGETYGERSGKYPGILTQSTISMGMFVRCAIEWAKGVRQARENVKRRREPGQWQLHRDQVMVENNIAMSDASAGRVNALTHTHIQS